MKKAINRKKLKGQIFVLFALMLPVIVMLCGLSMDVGLAYRRSAQLSRAVDATALRAVRKYSTETSERHRVIIKTFRANFPGFASGVSDTTGWDAGTGDIESTSGLVEKFNAGGDDWITVTTKQGDYDVMEVSMEAGTKQKTFFMKLAGDGFKNISFKEDATAERFPACNILILDNSGSMDSNGGSDYMDDAIKAFVEEFDDERDYLLIVAYNYEAWVLWPPMGNQTNPPTITSPSSPASAKVGVTDGVYVQPSRGFLTNGTFTADSTSGFSRDQVNGTNGVAEKLEFTNSTNAASAIRLAAICADQFYRGMNAVARSKIKFNYVFMTDGEFNAAPAYVQGYGFGYGPDYRWKKNGSGGSATYSLVGGTGKGTTFDYTKLPYWHFIPPVYGGPVDDPDKLYTDNDDDNPTSVQFKWYQTNGTVRATYDLRSVMYTNAPNLTTTPCILANITGSPGNDTLYMGHTILKDSLEIPSGSGSSNNTAAKINNYPNGKKWNSSWGSSTVKMSAFYPDFAHPAETDSSTSRYNGTATTRGTSTNWWEQWYKFNGNAWNTGSVTSGSNTSNYCDWVALAQIAYLRAEQNATFYAVGFDQADAEIMRNIANEKSDGTAMDSSKQTGKYYSVTKSNASTLDDVFRDIALRIGVRLSK